MASTLTILLLSGRSDILRTAAESVAGGSSVSVRPFEEKGITSPAKVRDALRDGKPQAAAFGCKDLDLQRFQVALKFYLLVYGSGRRYLLDETGRAVNVSWSSFVFVDLPRLVVEVVVSLGVLLHAAVRLHGLKRQMEHRP